MKLYWCDWHEIAKPLKIYCWPIETNTQTGTEKYTCSFTGQFQKKTANGQSNILHSKLMQSQKISKTIIESNRTESSRMKIISLRLALNCDKNANLMSSLWNCIPYRQSSNYTHHVLQFGFVSFRFVSVLFDLLLEFAVSEAMKRNCPQKKESNRICRWSIFCLIFFSFF